MDNSLKKKICIFAEQAASWLQYINKDIKSSNYIFEYTHDIYNCDILVVIAEGGWNSVKFKTLAKKRILFTGEPVSIYKYNSEFFNQFTDIVTSQQNVRVNPGVKIHNLHQCNDLFIGRNFYTKSFDEEKANQTFSNTKKTKLISAIASDKSFTEYHKKRVEFLKRLKNDIPELDIFGNSVGNPITYKDDAISNYKYSLVIENSCENDYWTEKLGDCIFSRTQPIYCGCTNIKDYFPDIPTIDINDYDRSLLKIKKIIENDIDIDELTQRRDIYLDKWQLHKVILRILGDDISYNKDIDPTKNQFILTINDEKFNFTKSIFKNEKIGNPIKFYGIKHTDHEYACRESHKNIIRYAIKNNLPYVIIFEDDAYPCDNCAEKIYQLLHELKTNNINWDILCLGICGTKYKNGLNCNIKWITEHSLQNYDNVHGATAYIIKCKAYYNIISNNHLPADFILSQKNLQNINAIVSKEMLFVQRKIQSGKIYYNMPLNYNVNCTQIGELALDTQVKPVGYSEKYIESSPNIDSIFFKIIIPNYNGFTYLKPCIESIIHQTYQNFKIIFVDDMSTDSSVKLMRAFSRLYPGKIDIIECTKKQFAGGCRNIGIQYPISCEYCVFMDSDDYFSSDKSLAILYESVKHSNPDMLLFNWDEDINGKKQTLSINQNINSVLQNNTLCQSIWCSCWSRIMKSDKIQLFLENGCMFGEDTYQLLKMFEQDITVKQIRDIIYTYRIRHDSVVHESNGIHEKTKDIFYNAIKELLKNSKNIHVKNSIINRLKHDGIPIN